ncbi:cupredoxin domain-containing protein [Mucilaginibacter glaciei]|uniref:Cytochrome C oxidase subunit II n=1 Tax=Mucilaginibacter glaciei TaxID=2772109 RepID=A0A926NPZ1_9SPHI|nr:cytochrome C oxidase subunit II [Mucilaginibacter glaciei]MBD1392927.1 cytochrome C oxidase subunit II [Mucilaginibacter glaciei]
MNKYEIRVIVLAGLLLSAFFFAILYNDFSRNIDVPACVTYSGTFKVPHVKKLDRSTYEVYGVAKMWAFTPEDLTFPEGSTIDLYLTSDDVVHGFNIVKKGVNLMAVPGATTKTTVTFETAGVYRILCHEYCGSGHQYMMGKITITPKKYY